MQSSHRQGVWYNRHRNIEGDWVPAAKVPRTPCGRIVAYVALHGHGTYHKVRRRTDTTALLRAVRHTSSPCCRGAE